MTELISSPAGDRNHGSALAAALVALQARMPEIRRGERATVETQKGRYTYSYASLAPVTTALRPVLAELGLAFSACPHLTESGQFVLRYRLVHAPSGEETGGDYPLPTGGTPQALGSAITYGRRYCLMAVTGAVSEEDDDDAAAASAAPRRQPRRGTNVPRESTDQGGMSQTTQRRLMATLKRAGLGEREQRLQHCSAAVGRDLKSSSDLSEQEARRIIAGLDELLAEKHTEEPA